MNRFLDWLSLGDTYFGNTLSQWAAALLVVVLSFALARTGFWLITRVLAPLTKRTRTDFDDILVEKVRQPAGLAIALVGSRAGLELLVLNEAVYRVVDAASHLLIALNIAWFLSRSYDAVHIGILQPMARRSKNSLDDQLLPVVHKGIRAVVWTLAVVVGLNNAGYDVMAVVGGMGIGGLAFALAAKDAVANIFGGLTIMTTRTLKLGQRVTVGSVTGTVAQVGLRNSLLVDVNGHRYSIPNKQFTDTPVANLDAVSAYWQEITLTLAHDTSAAKVRRALELPGLVAEASQVILDASYATILDLDVGITLSIWFAIEPVTLGEDPYRRVVEGRDAFVRGYLARLEEEEIRLAVETSWMVREWQGRGQWGL